MKCGDSDTPNSTLFSRRYARLQEIPLAIRELSQTNALICRVIEAYSYGDILTKEEMLCQMVVLLAKDWHRVNEEYARSVTLMGRPIFFPGQPVRTGAKQKGMAT